MIAVDASILVAFFLREDLWYKLEKYIVRSVSIDQVIKEFYNAVWKACYKQARISEDDARTIIDLFKAYAEKNLKLMNENDYIDYAYTISSEHDLSIYDALYLAMAKKLNLPFITLDKRQAEVALKLGIKLITPDI